MTNIWIKQSQNKRYFLEIMKNAVMRLGPIEVEFIERKNGTLTLKPVKKMDLLVVQSIIADIENRKNRKEYYGRFTTVRVDTGEQKTTEMSTITKMEFGDSRKSLIVYYTR